MIEYKCCVIHCTEKELNSWGFIYSLGPVTLGVGTMSVWMCHICCSNMDKEGRRPVGVDILFGLSACECGKRVKIVSGKGTEQKRIKRLTSYMLCSYRVSLCLCCNLNSHIHYNIRLFYSMYMTIVYIVIKTCHDMITFWYQVQ